MKKILLKILSLLKTVGTITGIIIIIMIALYSLTMLFGNSTSSSTADKTTPSFDFDKRFVTYKTSVAGDIKLDLETGCLYIRDLREMGPLYKNSTEVDCSQTYVDEYKNKNKNKK